MKGSRNQGGFIIECPSRQIWAGAWKLNTWQIRIRWLWCKVRRGSLDSVDTLNVDIVERACHSCGGICRRQPQVYKMFETSPIISHPSNDGRTADASGLFGARVRESSAEIYRNIRHDFPKSGSVLLEPLQDTVHVMMSCAHTDLICTAYLLLLDGLFKCRDAKCLHHGLRRLRLDLHFLAKVCMRHLRHICYVRFSTQKHIKTWCYATQDVTFPNIIFLPPVRFIEGYEKWKWICFRFEWCQYTKTRAFGCLSCTFSGKPCGQTTLRHIKLSITMWEKLVQVSSRYLLLAGLDHTKARQGELSRFLHFLCSNLSQKVQDLISHFTC